MGKRWHIYRDGQTLGPFEAHEIRKALREGQWDPFDLVSEVGVALKAPLVEVDEIFASTPAEDSAQSPAKRERTRVSVAKPPLPELAVPKDVVASEPVAIPDPPSAEAKEDRREGQRSSSRRKRDPKRFFLRDAKGRILGPKSAGEIQSLFYKGVLDKAVKVIKEGSTQAVPVGKFVLVYSENRRKKVLQGSHPSFAQGLKTSHLHQVAMAQNVGKLTRRSRRSLVAIAMLVVAVVVGGVAAWSVIEPQLTQSSRAERTATPSSVTWPKKSLGGKLKRPREFSVKSSVRKKPLPPRGRMKLPPKKSLPEPPKRRAAVVTPKAPPRTLPVRQTVEKAPVKVAPKPRPKAPPVQVAPKPAASRSSAGRLVPGQAVTHYGPCRYQVAAVKRCQGACSVTFVGPQGTFVGKFFGDAFKSSLIAQGGRAYLSGTVIGQGSQPTVIINSVK